jgi:hypothetical protein
MFLQPLRILKSRLDVSTWKASDKMKYLWKFNILNNLNRLKSEIWDMT